MKKFQGMSKADDKNENTPVKLVHDLKEASRKLTRTRKPDCEKVARLRGTEISRVCKSLEIFWGGVAYFWASGF